MGTINFAPEIRSLRTVKPLVFRLISKKVNPLKNLDLIITINYQQTPTVCIPNSALNPNTTFLIDLTSYQARNSEINSVVE